MDNFRRLQKLIKKVGYGNIKIIVQDGEPIRVEVLKQNIKIDTQENFEDWTPLTQD